jgi:hypothetical protein
LKDIKINIKMLILNLKKYSVEIFLRIGLFYLHSMSTLNKVSIVTGFTYKKEIALCEELKNYGWKCYVFEAI